MANMVSCTRLSAWNSDLATSNFTCSLKTFLFEWMAHGVRVTARVIGHLSYNGMNPLLKCSDMAHDSKGITQFYLPGCHPLTNHTCLYSPAAQHHHPLADTHCTRLKELYTEINFPAPTVEPWTRSPIPVLTRPGVE